MTPASSEGPERFDFLASYLARTPVEVALAPPGLPPHTNGHTVFVSAGSSVAEQRREMLLQSALLGAGSLDRQIVKSLRGRPSVASRYLALEGRRVLTELAQWLSLAGSIRPDGEPRTATPGESLSMAKARMQVDHPPEWFGVVKPSLLLAVSAAPGSGPTDQDLHLELHQLEPEPEIDDDDGEPSGESKILRLFENPLFASRAMSNFLRKLFGSSRASGDSAAGAELRVGSAKRALERGTDARPSPTRIQFTDGGKPGAATSIGGALYPEWDVHHDRYRPDWCRVIDFPLTDIPAAVAADHPTDDVLRRRLSRVSLGPKVLRGRPDGDELDVEALIDVFVDLRSGYSPSEHVYLDTRPLARNLGVLILLDASGSVTDGDPGGLTVHDHQCRAAATLAATLDDLGDRVALYAFRSQGRHAVHLPAIKTFDQHFGVAARSRLNHVRPSGFTRLGAGIRGAGQILKANAGTPSRLLVVLSDGYPYDDGYEGRYAEADTSKALEELRSDGVACLCLSIGTATDTAALRRVFGSAGFAAAATLADLSPRMDELFIAALRELAAPLRR